LSCRQGVWKRFFRRPRQNIKYLESLLDVRINARGQDVSIDGGPEDVETAENILEDFSRSSKKVAIHRQGTTRAFRADAEDSSVLVSAITSPKPF